MATNNTTRLNRQLRQKATEATAEAVLPGQEATDDNSANPTSTSSSINDTFTDRKKRRKECETKALATEEATLLATLTLAQPEPPSLAVATGNRVATSDRIENVRKVQENRSMVRKLKQTEIGFAHDGMFQLTHRSSKSS